MIDVYSQLKGKEMIFTRRAITHFAALPLLVCVLLTLPAGWLVAQTQAKSTLNVHITCFRNAKGRISIALYRDGKGFPSDSSNAVASQRLEIDPQTMTATAVFKNLPQGAYAASVFHDEFMTGKMEHNAMGIPQNGYGFSNNPEARFGPPAPEKAKFFVNRAESTIEIKLFYW
jgi:uncharacterized protein (DUF2141 family)